MVHRLVLESAVGWGLRVARYEVGVGMVKPGWDMGPRCKSIRASRGRCAQFRLGKFLVGAGQWRRGE